jgi:hypothetical protein
MAVDTSEVLKILAVQGMGTCISHQAAGGLGLSSDPGEHDATSRLCVRVSPVLNDQQRCQEFIRK